MILSFQIFMLYFPYNSMFIRLSLFTLIGIKLCEIQLPGGAFSPSLVSVFFLFWTCWAEVLSFCYSLRLDRGGGGRAGGGRKLRWWFTFWNKQEARPRSCPPARFVSYVARQPEGGFVSYVTETFLRVKLLNGHNSNINFQPYVRPVRSSTVSHQRVTKGKSPLGVCYFSTVLQLASEDHTLNSVHQSVNWVSHCLGYL